MGHPDVVIAGGGIVGSSIAYFLARSGSFSGRVVVVERDPTYARCATTRSAASIRHQFSTPENIAMSQFATDFLRELETHLHVPDHVADAAFVEAGYLFLATAGGEAILRGNHAVQRAWGADIACLEREALQAQFPWLHTEDLALGSHGRTGEGWFDPHSVLMALKRKAATLGVETRAAEVVDVCGHESAVTAVLLHDGTRLPCGVFVNATGARAGHLAARSGVSLPVHSRKRQVYVFDSHAELPGCPLVVDPSGLYFRPEGRSFIAGMSPPEDADPDCEDFETDHDLFHEHLWPLLAQRVPGFEALKLRRAWAGHYAVNTCDHNAVLGPHPELGGYFFANGFSGHGLQQAPAVGRGLAEWLVHGRYTTLDLRRLHFDRLADPRRWVREVNVV